MPLYPVQSLPIDNQFPIQSTAPTDISPPASKPDINSIQCTQKDAPKPRVVRLPEALRMTGLSRSTFLDRQNPHSRYHDPDFAQKISLGRRSVGWVESELIAWLDSRRQVGQKSLQSTRVDTLVNYGIPIQPKSTSTVEQASTTNKKGGRHGR